MEQKIKDNYILIGLLSLLSIFTEDMTEEEFLKVKDFAKEKLTDIGEWTDKKEMDVDDILELVEEYVNKVKGIQI